VACLCKNEFEYLNVFNFHERYCPAKKEGGLEGYHSIRFDFLHHRGYFLDTRKGLISRCKFQKTGFSV
jgi:hypothetical protein